MKYFDLLPKITVIDKAGTLRVYKNLMTRISVLPSIMKNPLLFYSYDIQDGDTPEIVAAKYYGDSYRYWIVMLSNQILDPQWDWPLNHLTLESYITTKYNDLNINPYTTVKAYQKIITQTNSLTGEVTQNIVELSLSDYNTLQEYSNTFNFTNETVLVSITKNIQTYYDYELEQNESKRNIKLLNNNYVSQLESEFKKLLNV